MPLQLELLVLAVQLQLVVVLLLVEVVALRVILSSASLLVVGIGCVVCLSTSYRHLLLAPRAFFLAMALGILSASAQTSPYRVSLVRVWMHRCWVLACGSSFRLQSSLLPLGVVRRQLERLPLDAGAS